MNEVKVVNRTCPICNRNVSFLDSILGGSLSKESFSSKNAGGFNVRIVEITKVHKKCVLAEKPIQSDRPAIPSPKGVGIPHRITSSDPRYDKPTLPKGYGTQVRYEPKETSKIIETEKAKFRVNISNDLLNFIGYKNKKEE